MQDLDSPSRGQKILVLGATGGTGRLIVSQAIEQGHQVTALVRSPAAAGALPGATLVTGDARDESSLRRALAGREAVISVLGTPASPLRAVSLLSTATGALVRAMQAEHVPRLICVTGLGAGDSRGHGGLLFDRIIFPLLLRKVYADKDRQEAIVRGSGLDWILVRPAILTDQVDRKPVRVLEDLAGFHGGRIARHSVAAFVLAQLRDDTWLHRAPLITT